MVLVNNKADAFLFWFQPIKQVFTNMSLLNSFIKITGVLKYQIDNNPEVQLNINTATIINNSNVECEWSIGAKGFIVHENFPNTNTHYSIKMTGTFSYIADNQTQTCVQEKTMDLFVPPPGCSITYVVTVNGLTVTIDEVDNPCNDQSISDVFTFDASNGNPTIISQGNRTIILQYPCQGDKFVTISYNQDGCVTSKDIHVYPIDPNLCCKINFKTNCERTVVSSDGNYKIIIKLKERSNKLVAIVRNFIKVGSKFKRSKTVFNGGITGPVYYNKSTCDCYGTFDFSKSKGPTYRKKVRIIFKFHSSNTPVNF